MCDIIQCNAYCNKLSYYGYYFTSPNNISICFEVQLQFTTCTDDGPRDAFSITHGNEIFPDHWCTQHFQAKCVLV